MTAAGAKAFQYDLEHFFPSADRQKVWDLFVDHEAWTSSDILPGAISVLEPGAGHPQDLGAVRRVVSGRLSITEDVIGFRAPEYFGYATRDGSLPVNDFGGELFLEQRADGLLARHQGGFNPKYVGTGRVLRLLLARAQRSAFRGLGKAYAARFGV